METQVLSAFQVLIGCQLVAVINFLQGFLPWELKSRSPDRAFVKASLSNKAKAADNVKNNAHRM